MHKTNTDLDVLEVLGSLNLADPAQRPALTAARAAVAALIAANKAVAEALAAPGAPTKSEREEMIGTLRAALARVQGGAL